MKKKVRTFENKVLRKIYGPVYDGYWRRRCNRELHKLFQDPGIVKMIKISMVGTPDENDEQPPCKKNNRG